MAASVVRGHPGNPSIAFLLLIDATVPTNDD
jgi:hypothetical protein